MKLSYDLHIHSCLSPCGSDDMTPNNIVNMAALIGLDVIALSDHNSCKNLPAISKVAEKAGILFVPAIEVCTAEEVHLLCYFESLFSALEFGSALYPALPAIRNRPDIYGKQTVLDENDTPIGEEEKLLINALTFPIERVIGLARSYGGVPVPAHVNKSAYSILSNLGTIPPEYGFTCIEVNADGPLTTDFAGQRISDSDAHYLEQIHEADHFIEVSERSVRGVLAYLKGG